MCISKFNKLLIFQWDIFHEWCFCFCCWWWCCYCYRAVLYQPNTQCYHIFHLFSHSIFSTISPPPRTELKSTSKTHVTFQCMPLQTSHIFTKREICIHSHCIQPPLPPSPPLSTPMRYTWQWYIYLTNSCDITAESLRRSDCVPTSTMGVRVFRKIGVHFSRTATNVSGLITEKHNKNTSLSG